MYSAAPGWLKISWIQGHQIGIQGRRHAEAHALEAGLPCCVAGGDEIHAHLVGAHPYLAVVWFQPHFP